MGGRYRVKRVQLGVGLAVAVLMIVCLSVPAAFAQVGLAVVLDLPSVAKVGQTGVAGNLSVSYANTLPLRDSNVVSGIALVPSCEAPSPSSDCVSGLEDPGVVAVRSPAIGRAGTACAGTPFNVVVSDVATGEVVFDPPGGSIVLGPGESCVIDFTFTVLASPVRESGSGTRGIGVWTTAHAGAFVIDAAGEVSAAAGTWRTWNVAD